jgi:hypothetical protein
MCIYSCGLCACDASAFSRRRADAGAPATAQYSDHNSILQQIVMGFKDGLGQKTSPSKIIYNKEKNTCIIGKRMI